MHGQSRKQFPTAPLLLHAYQLLRQRVYRAVAYKWLYTLQYLKCGRNYVHKQGTSIFHLYNATYAVNG
jgi:hypothetical protein